jgi:formate hydrogenlyase subunit 5
MKGTRIEWVSPGELQERAQALRDAGGRLQFAYAWSPGDGEDPELRYVCSIPKQHEFDMWIVAGASEYPSLAPVFPLLGWYEREMMDLQGLKFADHPEPYPLIIQRDDQSVPGHHDRRMPSTTNGRPHLPAIDAADVQQLPFGPIRADVFESAEFTFFYVGEHIIHYQPRLFFKHRGMETCFEGADPGRAVVIAERISGVGSVCHALAYCEAVERAAECEVPDRARALRVLLAEMERLYNHLHYLGHLCHTTTLKVGEAQGKLLEETAKQLNARLSGSRFLRGLLVPGGLRRDFNPGKWLGDALEELREQFVAYADRLEKSESHLDRLITTGPLPERVAFDQGATGPVERASGLDRDLRRDHAYALYDGLPLTVPTFPEGDAYARERVRFAEIEASFVLCQRILLLLEPGPVHQACRPAPLSEGLGWAEGPRGSLFYAVHIAADGTLARVKVKSPSFSNWRAFPFTVHDTNMMDYVINEASFGLTMAGCDR